MIDYAEVDTSVREILQKIGPETGLKKDVKDIQFADLNSITFVQLIVHLEGKYGIEFDDDILLPEEFKDLQHLIQAIHKEINRLKE